MNCIKAFLKGFFEGSSCLLNPKSMRMWLVGVIAFLSMAITVFLKSQIILSIMFVLTVINISLNYIWNCYKQTKIIPIIGLVISIVALIFCITIICF